MNTSCWSKHVMCVEEVVRSAITRARVLLASGLRELPRQRCCYMGVEHRSFALASHRNRIPTSITTVGTRVCSMIPNRLSPITSHQFIISRRWGVKFAFSYIILVRSLINLLSVGASLCETGLTSGRLAEHDVAVPAQNNSLGMAEDCGNLKASRALNIHEEGVGRLHKSLQLVCACFLVCSRVEKIDGHFSGYILLCKICSVRGNSKAEKRYVRKRKFPKR